jgi:sugar/nucleoside kinase (ribokinase family)
MLTVLGEAIVDLLATNPDGRNHPSGNPLNVAVALARPDEPTTLLARMSGQPSGDCCMHMPAAPSLDHGW